MPPPLHCSMVPSASNMNFASAAVAYSRCKPTDSVQLAVSNWTDSAYLDSVYTAVVVHSAWLRVVEIAILD